MKKAGRVILKVLSVMIFLAFAAGPSFAGDWGLVYRNDSGGTGCDTSSYPLSGLISKVGNGADIKVVEYSCSGCSETPTAPFISRKLEVVNADTGIVSGIYHLYNEAVVSENDDLVHKKVTFNTDGEIIVYWGVNDNLPSSPYETSACMKWYANE